MPLLPGIELQKVKTGVGSGRIREQAKAGDRVIALNPMGVRENVVHLSHDRVRALQGSGIRQLQLNEGVTLILFGDEAFGQALTHQSSHIETPSRRSIAIPVRRIRTWLHET